jgi:hypothetical protein
MGKFDNAPVNDSLTVRAWLKTVRQEGYTSKQQNILNKPVIMKFAGKGASRMKAASSVNTLRLPRTHQLLVTSILASKGAPIIYHGKLTRVFLHSYCPKEWRELRNVWSSYTQVLVMERSAITAFRSVECYSKGHEVD